MPQENSPASQAELKITPQKLMEVLGGGKGALAGKVKPARLKK